jgi:hypothetical protein
MHVHDPYTARQIAFEYTRERIRAAQAVRDAQDARAARSARRQIQISIPPDPTPPVAASRPWWVIFRRATPA